MRISFRNHILLLRQLFFILVILLISVPTNARTTQLPELGDHYRSALSLSEEKLIGATWMSKLRATNAVCTDLLINDYLHNLGHKLLAHADNKQLNFLFFGIDDDSINAFAFFGGHIGIHKGLILATRSESDLAAAIAHEIAHISQAHLLRHLIKNKQYLPITIAGTLAAAILGIPELTVSVLANHQQQIINFTREHEQEADNLGIQLLAAAGFDPHSMPTLFKEMQKQTQYNAAMPEYLLTHPIFASRISEAEQRAKQYKYSQHPSSLNYHLIKARVAISTNTDKAELLRDFNNRLTTQRYDNQAATLYGYALALAANNQPLLARQTYQQLTKQYPNNLIIQLSLLDTYIATQEYSFAINKSAQLLKKFPHNQVLTLKYAEILLAAQQYRPALKLLQSQLSSKVPEPLLYQLLAQAASMAGDKLQAHTATAEWHVLHGELEAALLQFDLALELAQQNAILTQQLTTRKTAIEDLRDKLQKL